MANKNAPISEFYEEDMSNLFMFFTNGKKEFWRFDKIKEMMIESTKRRELFDKKNSN